MLPGCNGLLNTHPRVVGTVKIGADLPLSGDDAPEGLPVRNAIELAVRQAGSVCGAASHQDVCVTLQAHFEDDVNKGIHDPAKGAANVRTLVSDDRVVGMVGPLYDGVAKSQLPIANAAGLAMVSPANTDECLTQEPSDGHCHGLAAQLRPHSPNNYFRIVTTQTVEGAAGADLAIKTLGKRRAFVISELTPIGKALGSEFAARFHRDGGVILNPGDLGVFDPGQTPDFSAPVTQARSQGTDVIYFAGSDPLTAALLRREMGAQMAQVPLIAGDRLASSQFAKSAGAVVAGSYYTVVGVDPAHLSAATSFLRDYRAAYAAEPTGLGVQAFDATTVLIRAVGRAIDDAGGGVPTRRQVLNQVAQTRDLSGLMGRTSFDTRGDTTLRLVSAYRWTAPLARSGDFVTQVTIP